MTEIERALSIYDGDGSKPYCDLVWQALKEKRDRDNGCTCSNDFKAAIKEAYPIARYCPHCGNKIKE